MDCHQLKAMSVRTSVGQQRRRAGRRARRIAAGHVYTPESVDAILLPQKRRKVRREHVTFRNLMRRVYGRRPAPRTDPMVPPELLGMLAGK